MCIFFISKFHSSIIFFISGIDSCQIPKAEVSQPVEIALKAQLHIHGFILTQTSSHSIHKEAIVSNCFKLVATINTHLLTKSTKFLGVSCPEICKSFHSNQAFNAL
jgi:hypothetical protein